MFSAFSIPGLIACATCMGNPGDHQVEAISLAILFMVGVLMIVLGSLVGFMVCLARRARLAEGLAEGLAEEFRPAPQS